MTWPKKVGDILRPCGAGEERPAPLFHRMTLLRALNKKDTSGEVREIPRLLFDTISEGLYNECK